MSDADAHPTNGDTAVTVFIGGQITIRNGNFVLRAGDQVFTAYPKVYLSLFHPRVMGRLLTCKSKFCI